MSQADFISDVSAHTKSKVTLSYLSKAAFSKKYSGQAQFDKVNVVEMTGSLPIPGI